MRSYIVWACEVPFIVVACSEELFCEYSIIYVEMIGLSWLGNRADDSDVDLGELS